MRMYTFTVQQDHAHHSKNQQKIKVQTCFSNFLIKRNTMESLGNKQLRNAERRISEYDWAAIKSKKFVDKDRRLFLTKRLIMSQQSTDPFTLLRKYTSWIA